jgi:hypothetical protein
LEQEKSQTEQLIHNISRKNNNRKNLTSNVTVIERDFFNYMAVSLQNTPYPGVDNYTRYAVARLGLLSLAGIEQLKPEYGPVINNVTSLRYPIAIPACQQTSMSTFEFGPVRPFPQSVHSEHLRHFSWHFVSCPRYYRPHLKFLLWAYFMVEVDG